MATHLYACYMPFLYSNDGLDSPYVDTEQSGSVSQSDTRDAREESVIVTWCALITDTNGPKAMGQMKCHALD